VANLDIRDIDGYQKGSIDFSSGFNFLGLSAWPNQNNLLVAISRYYFHLIYISSGQIGIYSIESPVELTYGICCKNIVDENKAQFFVKSKDAKEIVLVEISKRNKTCTIINTYASTLSKWQRLGGIACELGTYGLIGEMSTIYQITEEQHGYSHIDKMVILSGNPTTSHMFTMPFTVYSTSIPVLVTSSPSLIESAKAPVLNFRSYDSSGNFLNNFSSLFMGNFQPGEKSDVTIVNMLVSGISSITNVKLGITENGISGADVSDTVLYGVTETIDPSFVPSKYFDGVNTDNTASNLNNINVGVKDIANPIESKYIYLQIDIPERYMGRAYLTFRFFFDYED